MGDFEIWAKVEADECEIARQGLRNGNLLKFTCIQDVDEFRILVVKSIPVCLVFFI